MHKLIIAGSREFNDFDYLSEEVDKYINTKLKHLDNPKQQLLICTGGAKGADYLGYQYAHWRGIPNKLFTPDWHEYGKKAGILRNIEMAEYADSLIAFWNGRSKGTKNMIQEMGKKSKWVSIVRYNRFSLLERKQ